jgi:hypothetical protein
VKVAAPGTLKRRVQVASLKTLYALVQIRAAWRECLTRSARPTGSRPSLGK